VTEGVATELVPPVLHRKANLSAVCLSSFSYFSGVKKREGPVGKTTKRHEPVICLSLLAISSELVLSVKVRFAASAPLEAATGRFGMDREMRARGLPGFVPHHWVVIQA
jgi:hypothetical protein